MAIRGLFILLLCFALSGCAATAPGRIYTNVVRPYSIDFKETPVGSKHCEIDLHSVQEPFSARGITVEWTSGEILAAAEKAGIDHIYYTEERVLSILFGVYERRRLIVYGD